MPRPYSGLEFLMCAPSRPDYPGFRVQGSRFRVQGSGFRIQNSGFKVQGSGFRVQGSGFRVCGQRLRIWGVGFLADLLVGHGGNQLLSVLRPNLRGGKEREFFVDDLMVRIHLIIVMILVDRPCAMGVLNSPFQITFYLPCQGAHHSSGCEHCTLNPATCTLNPKP